MERTRMRPRPGRENTVSMTTVPAKRKATSTASREAMAGRVGRTACQIKRQFRRSPRARAAEGRLATPAGQPTQHRSERDRDQQARPGQPEGARKGGPNQLGYQLAG